MFGFSQTSTETTTVERIVETKKNTECEGTGSSKNEDSPRKGTSRWEYWRGRKHV